MEEKETVVVLGSSSKSDRYSNRAIRLLIEHGHTVIPVHPREKMVEGIPVHDSLAAVNTRADTITMYVNPAVGMAVADDIIRLNPRRVIFNPGTESPALRERLTAAGILVKTGCTIVMLNTRQF